MDQLKLTKKQIEVLNTSVDIFHKKGYVAASMRDIAKVLNVKAPSLYSHIKSKEEIFDWICQIMLLKISDNLQELSQHSLSSKDKFMMAVKLFLKTAYSDIKMFDVFLNNINRYDLELTNSKKYQENFQRLFEEYGNIGYEYLRSIKLEEEIDLPQTAHFAMNVLFNIYRWKPAKELNIDDDAEFLHRMLLFGATGERKH